MKGMIKIRENSAYCILSLDGGGAKGFYSLGVLREIEALAGKPLYETFDLVYGTSTGSIIGALISLGYTIDEIHQFYREYLPIIMKAKRADAKSKALERLAGEVFENKSFNDVKTDLGVVTTRWDFETPMIFKSSINQAHGRTSTFLPGFGCSLSDAVQASCSAYPFFNKKTVTTAAGDIVQLIDGGYCANNPTLYALADAVAARNIQVANCRVVSVGCGNYPEPKYSFIMYFAKKYILSLQLLQKTMDINTASMDQLRKVLFGDVQTVRINDTYDKPEMATNMFEYDLKKLNLLRQRGAESFAGKEGAITATLFD